MKQTTDIAICKYCGKEHSRKEVKRVNGSLSDVYMLGYCSALCYTKDVNEAYRLDKKETSISKDSLEDKFKVGAFVVSGAESTVYIESLKYGKQGISVSNFYKENAQPELEETAKFICEAVNNYNALKGVNAELLDMIKGLLVIFYKELQTQKMPDGETDMYPIIKAAIDKANKLTKQL